MEGKEQKLRQRYPFLVIWQWGLLEVEEVFLTDLEQTADHLNTEQVEKVFQYSIVSCQRFTFHELLQSR